MSSCSVDCPLPALHRLCVPKHPRLWAHDFARAYFFGDANRGYVSKQENVTQEEAQITQQYIRTTAANSDRCQLIMRENNGTIGTGPALCKQLLPDEVNRHILEQWRRFNPRSQKVRDAYSALIPYVNVILNDHVEVRHVQSTDTGWGLGVVAKQTLPPDFPLEVLSGFFVTINADEAKRLAHHSMDHSTVELRRYDANPVQRAELPQSTCNPRKRRHAAAELYQRSFKHSKYSKGERDAILVGPVSFINHGCYEHANCLSHLKAKRTLFERLSATHEDDPNVRGTQEWKAVMTRKRVSVGTQLDVMYADFENDADKLVTKKRLTKFDEEKLGKICALASKLTCAHC